LRNVKVNLTKYLATEAGLRYCPAVITLNGRIKRDIVIVNGQEDSTGMRNSAECRLHTDAV
jgi:hypothetical protein